MTTNKAEILSGKRFAFGKNWSHFLDNLNEQRIDLAEKSICIMLGLDSLKGKTFLDIGSGSGLFSLVAWRMGATVHSFDYDPDSVACTAELKRRFSDNDPSWIVEEGSVLDSEYMNQLGTFDVVYSWGVLHHTGAMWDALDNAGKLVARGGRLYIAIYNDQGSMSKIWLKIKKMYNKLPKSLRWLVLCPAMLRLWGPHTIVDLLTLRPFYTWNHYAEHSVRGMSAWHDVLDWVGGLPFEVAKPEVIFDFFHQRGFNLVKLKTVGGKLGCNEFLFVRN